MKLKLSGDRKVSPKSKTTFSPKTGKPTTHVKVMNAFGLPALESCPGFTDWCKRVCYAFRLQKGYTSVNNLVQQNLDILKSCGSSVIKMTRLLTEMVQSVNWYGTAKVFRWHWDGDIFSRQYAHAIARTCLNTPDVQHWLYTRSFDYVPLIIGIPNLTVYLSVDAFNVDEAKALVAEYPSLLIAACGDTWDESEAIMRKVVNRNAPRCPELTGKTPLVSPDGVGACVACGLCIYGRNHVRFASSH